ncbi:type VI secretion system baseplate subunit TssE [Flexibacterium corallicola]|uniref:type VI secretion system baseplate subunit TssE n=1 Tax=Flexibacterium corallicola TaxID=3037259 RepID=UPI00286F8D8F|nr:type VI secretion system baseplate subunit TssE [Pseudovibrio sp. M1P-2-3]
MSKRDETQVWDSGLRAARGTLFERLIADEEDAPLPTDRDGMNAKIQSIKRHLKKILNARAGAALAAPELGLDDLNVANASTGDLSQHISMSIRKCIEEYEPRVTVRSIEFVPDPDRPLSLLFKIQTAVPVGNQKEQCVIDILMTDGRVSKVY